MHRGRGHQLWWRKSTPIYQNIKRAVPHSWMVNSGYFIIGRAQFVGICGFFCKGTGSSLIAPSELWSAKPWEILVSTLWQEPGHNSGLAPFNFSPETTTSSLQPEMQGERREISMLCSSLEHQVPPQPVTYPRANVPVLLADPRNKPCPLLASGNLPLRQLPNWS